MLPETGKISLDNVRNELNIKGPISLGDINVRRLAGQDIPLQPQECDYYFEDYEYFANIGIKEILKKHHDDLNKITIGFSDDFYFLGTPFFNIDIRITPKMIVAKNITDFSNMFAENPNLMIVSKELFDNCPNATDFHGCFKNCYNIMSELPDVWNKQKFPKVTNGSMYAYSCTNAINYNEIPADFK